ncbi:MAG: anhydro-N-acetylmuramic acid kinase [Oxalobacter formigenes]|nr:anhydro-N-acetylmuramic acid kinase [Oxalobacter formigenes]
MSRLYIGLMTGTSMDGADGVLVAIPGHYTTGFLKPVATVHLPFSPELRNRLMALQQAGDNEIEREALAANELAALYARCVSLLLDKTGISPEKVTAIGVHGQTVRHCPEKGYTRQINNPALLAELTGIDIIADFRSRDIAAGGQGAPLVPAFHRALFGRQAASLVILNIGGIANISILGSDGTTKGFDTGPGNILMDAWIAKNQGKPYDEGGKWAASARPSEPLLKHLLAEPFLSLPPPKSTGRDLFNATWLETMLAASGSTALPPASVQATLAAFTAVSIARAIAQYAPETAQVFVCGGGAKNTCLLAHLRQALKHSLPQTELLTSETAGLDPAHIEALAFAWLAHRFTCRLPGNLPDVTGAKGCRLLGALYPALHRQQNAAAGETA